MTHPHSFGPYEVVAELGSGGMAVVYEARHKYLGRRAAVKAPKVELLNQQLLTRFQIEAQALDKLKHHAIVAILDYNVERVGDMELPYLVMEFMAGKSLADRLDERTYDLAELLPIVERLAAALDHAHEQGILHRDVKPGNVLFDKEGPEGMAYLSDFGIAKIIRPDGDLTMARLTGQEIPGTAAYLSPEQVRHEPFDHRIDVYALGVMIYQMLAGDVPYAETSPPLQAAMHATAPIPSIRRKRPDLPEAIEGFIRRALAKQPDERYQSAGALAAALKNVTYAKEDPRPSPASPSPRAVQSSRRPPQAAGRPKPEAQRRKVRRHHPPTELRLSAPERQQLRAGQNPSQPRRNQDRPERLPDPPAQTNDEDSPMTTRDKLLTCGCIALIIAAVALTTYLVWYFLA